MSWEQRDELRRTRLDGTDVSDIDIHHLGAAYALDALDERERAAYEAHYATCEICRTDVREFRRALDRTGIGPAVSHASYLINLGSANRPLRTASLAALGDEFRLNTMIDTDIELDEGAEASGALSDDRRAQLLQITREALSNSARHSGASRATIRLTTQDDDLVC